jgi:hypothetical protein
MTTTMAPERAAYSRMVLDHILANPHLHDQMSFAQNTPCGTTHCIAGWAVELSPDVDVQWCPGGGWILLHKGHQVGLKRVAEKLLGLTAVDAHRLFLDEMDNQDALDLFRMWIEEAEAAA